MKEYTEYIRSFVALAIDAKIQKEIGCVQEQLIKSAQKTACRVSWVKPETIHLTVKFLGDIPLSEVKAILNALQTAAQGISAFALQIEGLGVFPSQRNPRVIWVGISEGIESLRVMQPRVEQELAALGFPREKKKFNPHLTLGRIRSSEGAAALGEVLSTIPHPVFSRSIIQDIRLMKSDLRPTGAVYTELGRIPLT
ncbi:MAG: RNA 2',3'-cyclic phosphodiesterase [bacterium]